MSRELAKVTIPKFVKKVLSSKRRKTKYKNGKITNKSTAGKPKYLKINTQNFYSGYGSYHERISIMNGIKDNFRPFIENNLPVIEDLPVIIHMGMYDTLGQANWDLDNKAWVYFKAFQDLLTEQEKIPDDNISYITGNHYTFYPVDKENDRKLIFQFLLDDRKEIVSNEHYKTLNYE